MIFFTITLPFLLYIVLSLLIKKNVTVNNSYLSVRHYVNLSWHYRLGHVPIVVFNLYQLSFYQYNPFCTPFDPWLNKQDCLLVIALITRNMHLN